MTVHSPGPIIWTFNDLTIYLRASLFFVTFWVRPNRPKTRTVREARQLGRELIGISVRYRSVFSQYEGAIPYKYKFQLEDHVCDNTLVNPKLCNYVVYLYKSLLI